METLAIVRAPLAGLSAARAARTQGFTGRLVVIGDEHRGPSDRPAVSKDFLLGTITAEDLLLETDDDGLHAEWVLGLASDNPVQNPVEAPQVLFGRDVGRHDGSRISRHRIVVAGDLREPRLFPKSCAFVADRCSLIP